MSVDYGGAYPPTTGRVDLGGWLGQAWALFSARPGVWIVTLLFYSLIVLLLWLLWSVPTGVLEDMRQMFAAIFNHTPPPAHPQNPFTQFARNEAFTLLLTGILAIFTGGLYKMGLRQARGESISAAGLFSGFSHALPLLMVTVTVGVCVALFQALCMGLFHLAGLSANMSVSVSGLTLILPSLVLEGLLMFAPFLVIDRRANAAEAITGSIQMLKGQWLMATLAYFVLSFIGGIGFLVCGIGILATYPLFVISIAAGYLAFTQPPPAAYPSYPASAAPPGVWPPPPGPQ